VLRTGVAQAIAAPAPICFRILLREMAGPEPSRAGCCGRIRSPFGWGSPFSTGSILLKWWAVGIIHET